MPRESNQKNKKRAAEKEISTSITRDNRRSEATISQYKKQKQI